MFGMLAHRLSVSPAGQVGTGCRRRFERAVPCFLGRGQRCTACQQALGGPQAPHGLPSSHELLCPCPCPSRETVRHEIDVVLRPRLPHTSLSVSRAVEGAQKHYCTHAAAARLNQPQVFLHLGSRPPRLGQLVLLGYVTVLGSRRVGRAAPRPLCSLSGRGACLPLLARTLGPQRAHRARAPRLSGCRRSPAPAADILSIGPGRASPRRSALSRQVRASQHTQGSRGVLGEVLSTSTGSPCRSRCASSRSFPGT